MIPGWGGTSTRGISSSSAMLAGEERAGAAGGDERELARVVAAADRVELDRLGHPELLDLQRAERGLLNRHPERVGERLHRRARELDVELHLAAEQAAVGSQPAQQELRVGRGRLRAAAAVAGGARVGARGLRADAEDAALVDVGDRAAAGADRVDVDHRHHRLVVADLRVEQMAHAQLPARGDADVGRRAADVERDDVLVAGQLPRPDAADQAGHRPGHEQVDWPLRRRLDGRHAARRLHQLDAVREPGALHRLVEAGHVPRDLRADVRVQAGGREALELAVQRQDLVRDREVRLRELLEHDLLDPLLVGRVEVGVEQADRNGLDARRSLSCRMRSRTSSSSSGTSTSPSGTVTRSLHGEPVAALDERPRLPRQAPAGARSCTASCAGRYGGCRGSLRSSASRPRRPCG